MQSKRITIVGAGIAGLVAAVESARRGWRVTLIEQAKEPGGRAGTEDRDGFKLNLGPHALYRNGPLQQALDEWKVPYTGRVPDVRGTGFFADGTRKIAMPLTAGDLLWNRQLTPWEKITVASTLQRMRSDRGSDEPVALWLDHHARSKMARQMAESLIRVGSFTAAMDRIASRSALRQFQHGSRNGVLYVDGGWTTLVEGLRLAAERAGVSFVLGEQAVEANGARVRTESGTVIEADRLILATAPVIVERITGRKLPSMTPIRLASLDLCLRKLPVGSARFILGLDQPFYYSVHSDTARLAPEGKVLVHVAKYLTGSGECVRRELEDFAEIAMPGWRAELVADRYLPAVVVSHALHDGKRPDVDVLGDPRILIAGEWVGNDSMLADAAAASGLLAAKRATGSVEAAAA